MTKSNSTVSGDLLPGLGGTPEPERPRSLNDRLKSIVFDGAEAMGISRAKIAQQLHKTPKTAMDLWLLLVEAENKDDSKSYFMACLREPAKAMDRDGAARKRDGMPPEAVARTSDPGRWQQWAIPGQPLLKVYADGRRTVEDEQGIEVSA